jgi:hypothetical protein
VSSDCGHLSPERRIAAGVSVEDALRAFHESVTRPETTFSRDHWLMPKFERLRQLLSDPITEDHAAALLDVLHQRRCMADLIEWLESPPVPWAEFFGWRKCRDMERSIESQQKRGYGWPVDLGEQKVHHCPRCNSRTFVPIVCGYPTEEALAAARRGELVLGGCSLQIDGPNWYCPRCRLSWR